MWEAWRSGGFVTYPQLPGWRGPPWSLLLVPGWQRLNGMQIPQIVAHQWAITTETMLDDLEKIDPARVQVADYSTFLASPQDEIERLSAGVGLSWDRSLGSTLPLSKTTVSAPEPDKWRRVAQVVDSVWPIVEKADLRARAFLESRGVAAQPTRESRTGSAHLRFTLTGHSHDRQFLIALFLARNASGAGSTSSAGRRQCADRRFTGAEAMAGR